MVADFCFLGILPEVNKLSGLSNISFGFHVVSFNCVSSKTFKRFISLTHALLIALIDKPNQ